MRISRVQAEKNREQILKTACALFRDRGFEGIGVSELMGAAGFTHGGFYGHFGSKEELILESCARTFAEKEEFWKHELDNNSDRPLMAIAKHYLTASHRDKPATGCPLASWATDVARQPRSIRRRFTDGLRHLVELLVKHIPGKTDRSRYHKSLSIWATLVGAIVLARATDDSELSEDILRAAIENLRDQESR